MNERPINAPAIAAKNAMTAINKSRRRSVICWRRAALRARAQAARQTGQETRRALRGPESQRWQGLWPVPAPQRCRRQPPIAETQGGGENRTPRELGRAQVCTTDNNAKP